MPSSKVKIVACFMYIIQIYLGQSAPWNFHQFISYLFNFPIELSSFTFRYIRSMVQPTQPNTNAAHDPIYSEWALLSLSF